MTQKNIMVLGTGGTIAGTGVVAGANTGYRAGQLEVDALLRTIAGLSGAAGARVLTEQVANVDSKDMGSAVWHALVPRCLAHLADPAVRALVITHGTDTLEETAWLLHELLPAHKPVLLTCAMRPATALAPDGPQNLLDALVLAADPGARGVLVSVAGRVWGARDAAKVHPLRLDAFDGGGAGPLAWVEEGRVRWADGRMPQPQPPTWGALAARLPAQGWPRVDIVLSHAGADGALVDALCASGVRGIVVAATGNGTLHQALEAALVRAVTAGVTVRVASRCPQGALLPISGAPWRDSAGLSPVKARISLMLELMAQGI